MLKVVCEEVSSEEVACEEEEEGGEEEEGEEEGVVEEVVEGTVEEVVEDGLCDEGAGVVELGLGGSTFVSSCTNQMSVPKMAIYRFWWSGSQLSWRIWATTCSG